jgi:hypothetical protein
MRSLSAVLMATAALAAPTATAADPPAQLAPGRELSRQFLDRKLDPVWARFTPQMKQAVGSREKLGAFREQVAAELGEEVGMAEERVVNEMGMGVYLRAARWSKAQTRIVMQWSIDSKGMVAGFGVRPEAPPPVPLPAAPKAPVKAGAAKVP